MKTWTASLSLSREIEKLLCFTFCHPRSYEKTTTPKRSTKNLNQEKKRWHGLMGFWQVAQAAACSSRYSPWLRLRTLQKGNEKDSPCLQRRKCSKNVTNETKASKTGQKDITGISFQKTCQPFLDFSRKKYDPKPFRRENTENNPTRDKVT